MHFLFLIYSLEAGGAERVAVTLANHWLHCGHRVTMVTLASASLDFYMLDPRANRVSLELADFSSGFWIGVFANLRRLSAIRHLLDCHRPNVAIALMPSSNVLLSLACIGRPGTIVIGSERLYPPAQPLGAIWSILRWLAYSGLDAVVAQTQLSARWLRRCTLARRVVVIPNPLAPELPMEQRWIVPSQCLLPGDKLLLAAGRLCHQKGFDLLLQAFALLAPAHPDWRLVILGDGPDRPGLEKQVEELAIQSQVILPGCVGNIHQWYERADLFVLSSRYEGYPNVLAEAMAAGLAVVSTNCLTGPADLVCDGVNGRLVPAGNSSMLVQALEQAMLDEALRHCWASQARQLSTRLDTRRIAEAWELLFHQLRRIG